MSERKSNGVCKTNSDCLSPQWCNVFATRATGRCQDLQEKAESMVGGRQNAVAGAVSTLLKYLIEGLAVAIVAYALPAKKLKLEEIAMIAVTGAATFAILDMYAPATSGAARMGAGFGVGGNLVGFA
jgi:hypothetical protein